MSAGLRRVACLLCGLLCGLLGGVLALAGAVRAAAPCGERHELPTHGGSRSVVSLSQPAAAPAAVLVLLAGGSGHLQLDEVGCPRQLKGNALLRMRPLWVAEGFATLMVDAPSDWQGEDGLAGFRADPAHAEDIGQFVRWLRVRLPGVPVWLVGTSRGTISAVHAAARLQGPAAPDGLVLSSLLSAGQAGARKPWVGQTVFDAPLGAIRQPLLLLGHAEDRCPRSPPERMPELLARVASVRAQQVLVQGGPGGLRADPSACEGRSPHGFVEQEAEVAAGVARFVRGASY
ncbi:alpha/beta hydrolase [Inhella sp.]|uniref:alpha/beta hydrolase n=1 Tax=Inhella sp. TaxID=1921806 RepID=UPI0035ADC436